jgi:hypothetical protein
VCIGVANAHTENGVAINHHHDFVVSRDERFALGRKESYHTTAITKAAKCELSDYGWMA